MPAPVVPANAMAIANRLKGVVMSAIVAESSSSSAHRASGKRYDGAWDLEPLIEALERV
jgi:hypothetical protein